MYIIDGNSTISIDVRSDEEAEMIKIGDIKFFKYYSTLKSTEEPIAMKGEDSQEDFTTHKVSIKIAPSKKVFVVKTYTNDEARGIRKILPQFT